MLNRLDIFHTNYDLTKNNGTSFVLYFVKLGDKLSNILAIFIMTYLIEFNS